MDYGLGLTTKTDYSNIQPCGIDSLYGLQLYWIIHFSMDYFWIILNQKLDLNLQPEHGIVEDGAVYR